MIFLQQQEHNVASAHVFPMPEEEQKRGKAVHFACGCDAISLNKTCLLGGGLLPTVTTTFLVGDCYKKKTFDYDWDNCQHQKHIRII